MQGLPQWTLGASLEGDVLEFSLGDGRRLAWRSRRPAGLLDQASGPMPAAALLGAELADHLARSAPRLLNIQFDEALDRIAWETLALGADTLAEHFALGRQLVSGMESAPSGAADLADVLAVTIVQDGVAASRTSARHVALEELEQAGARELVSTAHVLVLEGVTLARMIERASLPRRECLLVLRSPLSMRDLATVLDAGAAVLAFGQDGDLQGAALGGLSLQLGAGASVGEAMRWLHRRAAPAPLDARLYGDPGMRFVAVRAPTSRRQVTSLSFDIVGSTSMLQRLGDEAYADMLGSLHARCTGVVRRQGGQPDDPQGNDGVMCYFGHPAALEDAAVRAVEAGLMIIRTVAELGVSVRVGIATGLVAIKADQPVGLSIHLAARLQQATAPGTVLTSEATRRLVAHAFHLKVLAPQPELKGIDESEAVHLVLGPSRDGATHRLEGLAGLTPLVGRQAEIERLQACWRHTRADACRLAVVRAEAGMGKSRLVREFHRQLLRAGARVLECRCRADASASPYLALTEALRRWLAAGVDDDAAGALRELVAALPGESPDSEAFALLAALLGLAPPPVRSTSGGLRQRLLGLLADCLVAFAQGRPCCLIVEDWHWVDPSTRDFVDHLAARRAGPGLLVVITIRGEATPAPLEFEHDERIELAGLPPEGARELVNLVCANAPLPSGLVRMLAARGDGVPLFLEEAARMALDLGADCLGADLGAVETVPASLQDLLTARLDGLGTAGPVAQVAAVLGREFPVALLAALLETGPFALDAVTLAERLDVLVNSGLVRSEGGGQFAFKHALIRDAAYASLWARDRRALHARVVELIEQRWPELATLRPELLALHQTEAGLHGEALAQWMRAASNAAARSAELEAISHLRRALAVLARVAPGIEQDRTALRLQLLLAARLIATEGYGAEAVLHAYLEAERLCDQLGDQTARFKVEMGLEAYRFMRADFGPALEHGRRAAAIAAGSGDVKQRLHAHWGLACTLFHQGNLRATMREMETALAVYTPAMHAQFGIQDPGVMCMAYSSWGLWEIGRPDSALVRIDHAVAMAGEFEHKFSQAVALAYGVSIELLRGDTDAALTRAAACIRVCDE
ncbi:MAG: AAA family ATPase, partial [Betaproteobacteria bacterium]